jgi:hypothetical protein
MSSWINRNFDIDLWIKLAADNPYKFEIQRQQWLEETIAEAKAGLQPRLRGILWEINMDLEIAKHKFTKCRLISMRLVNHLNEFKDILRGHMPYINQYPARIFDFTSREEHPS